MAAPERIAAFESMALPHARAAYNMARWMTHNDHEAEDLLQEAYLRAFRYFDSWQGQNPRTWFLTIVRNVCFDWLGRQGPARAAAMGSAEEVSALAPAEDEGPTHESALIRAVTTEQLDRAIRTLPPDFREVFLLREVEGLAYKEIAEVAAIPIGTVMSRLARARRMLQGRLARDVARGEHDR